MNDCPAHTDKRHSFRTKCVCGDRGVVHLSIVGDDEALYIGLPGAVLVTEDSLYLALRGTEPRQFDGRADPMGDYARAVLAALSDPTDKRSQGVDR